MEFGFYKTVVIIPKTDAAPSSIFGGLFDRVFLQVAYDGLWCLSELIIPSQCRNCFHALRNYELCELSAFMFTDAVQRTND